MHSQAVRITTTGDRTETPGGSTALHAEPGARFRLARDEGLPSRKTTLIALAAAAVIWAVVLIPVVLFAGN